MTDELRPTLVGERVTVRPGRPEDVDALRAIRADLSVARWWGDPEPRDEVEAELGGTSDVVLLVIEVAGEVAGGIQYHEERDPMYHHAGIDIYLGAHWQDRGLGSEAIRLLAQFLFEQRGHHRLVIDPAVANARAIAAYAKVGFRPVGVMRQYEQGADGHVRQGAQGLNTAGTGAAQWKLHSDHVSSTATKGKRSPSLDASSGSRPPLSKPAALSA